MQLADRLDQIATRLGRSRELIVKEALTAWIDKEEAPGQLTLAALADVDNGCLIDHQTVQAWADSLSNN